MKPSASPRVRRVYDNMVAAQKPYYPSGKANKDTLHVAEIEKTMKKKRLQLESSTYVHSR